MSKILTLDDLHDYQHQAAQRVYDSRRLLLLADMGTGKTVMELTGLMYLLDAFRIRYPLIVAPASVALTVWPAEIKKWEHLQHLSVDIIDGHFLEMQHQIENSTATITIIGTHRLRWLYEHYWAKQSKRKKFWKWDALILDESSKIKSPSSKIRQAAKSIAPKMKMVHELTAKPIPHGYRDIWTQVHLLDGGVRLYKTHGDFTINYFNHNMYEKTYTLINGGEESILSAIADISHRVDAVDHLPPLEHTVIDIDLSLDADTQERYNTFEENLILEFDAGEVEVFNAASRSNKLRQIANGSVIVDTPTGAWEVEHATKLDACAEIIEAAQNKPIIIVGWFKSDRARLQEMFPDAETFVTKHSVDIERRWNKGEIPLLITHPDSFSHGLNLQEGGHIMIFYTLPWGLDQYEQCIGRILRQGQEHHVFIYRLIMRGTVEDAVVSTLEQRGSTQTNALAQLKLYLAEKFEHEFDW